MVQFHRRKQAAGRKTANGVELPEESVLAQMTIDSVKVEKLVREFLHAQSLTILPQNAFGDAVAQFVDKDDKNAMENFVNDSLKAQVQHLVNIDQDDPDLQNAIEIERSRLEELFKAGHLKRSKNRRKLNAKPDNWDSELDGNWSDDPAALVHSDIDGDEHDEDDDENRPTPAPTTRGRGRGRGRGSGATTTRGRGSAKTAAPTRAARGRKRTVVESEDDADGDAVMLDDDNEDVDTESLLFLQDSQPTMTRSGRTTTIRGKAMPARGGTQTKLTQTKLMPTRGAAASQASKGSTRVGTGVNRTGNQAAIELSDDVEDSDDDAFESGPVAPSARKR